MLSKPGESNVFDTTKYEWRIVNEGDRLNFIFTSEGTIIGTVTSMRIVDLAKNPYIDPERTNYNKESDDEFTVTAHILAKDFSKDSNVSFTAISNSKKSMDSNFQQAANIELRFAFQGWEDLLKTQANMTLASIGFTSYK